MIIARWGELLHVYTQIAVGARPSVSKLVPVVALSPVFQKLLPVSFRHASHGVMIALFIENLHLQIHQYVPTFRFDEATMDQHFSL